MKSLLQVKQLIHSRRHSVNGLNVVRDLIVADAQIADGVKDEALKIVDRLLEVKIDHDLGVSPL